MITLCREPGEGVKTPVEMVAPHFSAFTPLPQTVRIPEPQTYQYSMFVKTLGHAVTNSFHGINGIQFQTWMGKTE